MNFKNVKKLFAIVFVCALFSEVAAAGGKYASNGESEFSSGGLLVSASYYGFPMSVMAGWHWRRNDFDLVLPFAAGIIDMNPDFQVFGSSGVKLSYKDFYVLPSFKYEFYSPAAKSFSSDTEFFGNIALGIRNSYGRVELNSSAGRKRWTDRDFNTAGEFTLIENLNLSVLLFDSLGFKATSSTGMNLKLVPEKKFSSYDLQISLPFQFNWYYGESCFLYDVFYTETLDVFSSSAKNLLIEKSYSAITRRVPFKGGKKTLYRFATTFETEQRLYPSRFMSSPDNFYVSLFANAGFCISEDSSMDFLYQYGLGLGYNLFGCVPFTFQIGLDGENRPVMFLGIISRITHGF